MQPLLNYNKEKDVVGHGRITNLSHPDTLESPEYRRDTGAVVLTHREARPWGVVLSTFREVTVSESPIARCLP